MKKNISIVLALILVLSFLTGCGGSNEAVVTPATETTAPDTAELLNFTRGTVKDNVYTSEYSGIVFEVPEGWTVSTDEELATLMGIGSEYMSDDLSELAESAQLTTIYDFMCKAPNGTDSFSIDYENVKLEGFSDISEEEFAEALSNTLITGTSFGYEEIGVEKKTLGSYEYVVLTMAAEQYGLTQSYFLRLQGDYMITLIFTSKNDDPVAELKDCFK